MQPGLNFNEDDDKFILLGKVYEFLDLNTTKDILSRNGFRKRAFGVICIKIFFMSLFFNYELSKVIDELNNKEELRNFAGIKKVPTETQVSEYFSRHDALQFFKMFNAMLRKFYRPKKCSKNEYIVDATPVACDINVIKQFIKDKKLEKLGLKWGYSTTKKHFIGFKVTVVIERNTVNPVAVFIHPGAPNDSRIFEKILKELDRRHLIKFGDVLYFDKGYFSHENYQIGINKYRIIPVIFPKSGYDISKMKGKLSFPLEIYKDTANLKESIEEITDLIDETIEYLNKWEDFKSVRGIIEDFFKAAKGAFGLDRFHSYKNILLCLLLTSIVVNQGFNTKTQLQRLSEGYVNLEEPKINKKNDKSKKEESDEKDNEKETKEVQVELSVENKAKRTNLFNYQEAKSSKSESQSDDESKSEKSQEKITQNYFDNFSTNGLNHIAFSYSYNRTIN